MGLFFLIVGSVVGVSVMVFFNARLGISTQAKLSGLDEAIMRLDTDRVGFEAGEGVLAADGEGALVAERSGACLGLVVARGSDFVIRYLGPGRVRDVAIDNEHVLHLRLNDFVFAPARLRFDSAEVAADWAERLTALQAVAVEVAPLQAGARS
ncbi:hypothetical protein [Maricaulis maris]|uniref:Uncharacterized protein n=1 Tax=Maricaulis maris TaxID=74318 RepID=A0A495DJC1_9PROT|nr:hypothetical protein [Maricaulis maris]RKR02730.1 hypothetical protein C7435_0669 [Maricaulis maris]